MKLVDSFGRIHTALRLSVTDRCNIRCFYCMPSEQVQFLPRPELLSFEEIVRVTKIFTDMGVNKLRLTGGEPLVRRDLPLLVSKLRQISAVKEIAITTNAILLENMAVDLKTAGLDRINVSLDTLDAQQFLEITKRDQLSAALAGIAAARSAGFQDIRLNAVAIKGLIEEQIVPLAKFSLENQLTLRFIEFMPLNSTGKWSTEEVLTGDQVRDILESEYGPLQSLTRQDVSQPAKDFGYGAGGKVGFINSVSQPFCQDCNRLRLTAEGKIRNCLFSQAEWDVRQPLRDGSNDQQIMQLITDCVVNKKAAHGIGSEDFQKPERAMYQIGG